MYANVTLCGRLASDPVVRETKSGTKVVTATVVTSRRTKKGQDWVEEPNFIDATLWGKRGETFAKYHSKGSPCLVFGTLAQDKWESADGKRGSKHVVADADFTFLPKQKDSDGGGQPSGWGSQANEAQDVPF